MKIFINKVKPILTHPTTIILVLLFMKIIAFRIVVFHNKSVFHIALIEFPLWAFLLSLIVLFVKKHMWTGIFVFNSILSILFIAIIYYTRYFSTIPSYYDLQQLYQSNSVGGTIGLLSTPYDFLFFLDLVLFIPIVRYFNSKNSRSSVKVNRRLALIFGSIGLITTLLAFRQPLIDVSYFAKENGYLQSQAVQVFTRSFGIALASDVNLSEKDVEKLKGNDYVPANKHESYGIAKDRHVFVIQVESLQGFVINRKVNNQEITPNLNALLKDSTYFDNVFQQIGAGNTSDAEWLMHTSIYPEGMDPTVNVINGEPVPSLPRTLQRNGYGTATYHADEITYWSREKLYPALGFDYVYTDIEIPAEQEIGFGPADEVLFDFASKQLPVQLKKHKKIYSNIVTLTSHTPFEMPEHLQYLRLPDSYENTYVGNYLQSVRYTDEQIGVFIETLKKEGIYDNSLILLYGDHSGVHGAPVTKDDEAILLDLLGHPYNLKDRFIVPVIFSGGGLFNGETISHLGGQIDLMPTLLNLLSIEHDAQMIGHNLFQYEHNLLGMRYHLPGSSFINDNSLYVAPSAKLPAILYNSETMKEKSRTNKTQQSIDNALQIMQQSDQILKSYSNR
ncbi:LTA synthase family protein [Sporosarcina sp. ANT_H38]|uniref:LTA synthase family protein n=1 Tax=Sporosarcina sp. ANT_H38 TaxID=2597358 RepID=UPI0011F3EE1F|nr:LTA synthase family protein [Sporosarcina sp. ANT_H38]KAA0965045.1 LTA synthase family protein [Sporosarcina sp. ANT_H38]